MTIQTVLAIATTVCGVGVILSLQRIIDALDAIAVILYQLAQAYGIDFEDDGDA